MLPKLVLMRHTIWFSHIINGRKLICGHCIINNIPYDVKEFTIKKNVELDGKIYDYIAVCRITSIDFVKKRV